MVDDALSQPVHHVWNAGIAPEDILQQACHDSAVRKNVLKAYRKTVVRPLLLEVDEQVYAKDATKFLPGLQCAYRDLHHEHGNLMKRLIFVDVSWRHVKI